MRKLAISIALVLVGSGMWWTLSHTARFSMKKWDAKFESTLRHGLNQLGVSGKNLISSVHEIQKDSDGKWVSHKMTVEMLDEEKIDDLVSRMKKSGAQVDEFAKKGKRVLMVKRGSRVYQEINFVEPLKK